MMGYRSYGAIWFSQEALNAISKEDNDLIKRDIENDNFTHVHSDADTDNYGIIDGIILEFEEWKWYDSYKDIAQYNAMFKMLEEKKIDYDFIRFGEDNTDNELHTQKKFYMSRNYEVI